MPDACLEVLEYTRRHVTPKDIADFAPGDPGYPNYVRVWTEILETGRLPERAHFDITETIGLTRWSDATRERDERRYRRFRLFTNAVAMAMYARDDDAYETMPPNYVAISLIDDGVELKDMDVLLMARAAFAELHAAMQKNEREEAVFVLLAMLLIDRITRTHADESQSLITQLIRDAEQHTGWATDEFLWGCTHYDQLHRRWKSYVYRYLAPTTPEVASLRARLLPSGR